MSRPLRWGSTCPARLLAALLGCAVLTGCGGAQAPVASEGPEQASSAAPPGQHTEADARASLNDFRNKLAGGLGGAHELNLAAKGWGPELGPLLAESAALESLSALDVSDNDLGVTGARAIAGSAHLSALRDLDLGGNDIGDQGAIAVANAKVFAKLETLNVSGNSIAGPGAEALVQGSAKKLSSLDLSMNSIGAPGAAAIGKAHLSLTALYLLGCEIGPGGVKEFTQSKHLSALRVLALSGNNLGDEGAQALSKSSALGNLTTLDLCANGVSDAGALALAQSPHLKKLKILELFGNEIGTRGAEALKKRFGSGLHM
jgi:Ran GTPase-activating protein (RanGAP) involved in mRNA processing and transport